MASNDARILKSRLKARIHLPSGMPDDSGAAGAIEGNKDGIQYTTGSSEMNNSMLIRLLLKYFNNMFRFNASLITRGLQPY
jgi:hypothetical protein